LIDNKLTHAILHTGIQNGTLWQMVWWVWSKLGVTLYQKEVSIVYCTVGRVSKENLTDSKFQPAPIFAYIEK
jgi:hypothetical protein